MDKKSYLIGRKAAWENVLSYALKELSIFHTDDPEIKLARMELERVETISMLRNVCQEHGDNDWDDNLYLPDIIEKHLWRNLT